LQATIDRHGGVALRHRLLNVERGGDRGKRDDGKRRYS